MFDVNKERETFEAWLIKKFDLPPKSFSLDFNDGVYDSIPTQARWEAWKERAKTQAVPEKKIYLTCEQLYAAANFGAPNKDPELLETELTIAWFDEAHSGSGYYVYISEYPEEGAMKLESESGA
ncbi:hypothetical protein A0141_RS19100, partial [Acinetobacter baumannii]|nr:hypothetical protein [Acinetobacter baumannii]